MFKYSWIITIALLRNMPVPIYSSITSYFFYSTVFVFSFIFLYATTSYKLYWLFLSLIFTISLHLRATTVNSLSTCIIPVLPMNSCWLIPSLSSIASPISPHFLTNKYTFSSNYFMKLISLSFTINPLQ